jgi:hypothetical protein
MNAPTTQYKTQLTSDENPDLPVEFKGGRKDKVEKEHKVSRKTTKEDIQLELDLYPLREGETMQFSIDSSIRIARPQ